MEFWQRTMEDINNYSLLIVGGEGFIGKYLADEAFQKKYDVTIITPREHPSNLEKKYEIICCDICDRKKLLEKLKNKKFNYVINCSGCIEHDSFNDGGRKYIEQHFSGVLNLIELIDKKYLKTFIQLGSSDEYGSNEAPQTEEQRESPISPYSLGKTATTHFLQMLHRQEDFPVIIFRLFLVYGPGQSLNRFIPQTINACLKNITFPVSKGDQLRDFCYIDDITGALFSSLDNSPLFGEVINLASGQPTSIKMMVRKIQDLTGGGNPDFGKVDYRLGENMRLYANIEKAKKIFNWSPSVSHDEGLKRTIDYYRNKK